MAITKKQLFDTSDFRATYNKPGKPSFERKLKFASRKNNLGFKNFNEDDTHLIAETLKKSEKKIRRTGAMSRYAIKKAGQEVYQAYKSGEISKIDYQKAKEIYKGFNKSNQVASKQKNIRRIIPRRYDEENLNPTGTISAIMGRKLTDTGIAHGTTSISQIINRPKPLPTTNKFSPSKPLNRNFGLKV